jgi:uncharacterized protein YecE (DUF72 family)
VTGRTLVGTCSWTDRTLVRESGFYPRRSMKADERLRHYASIFPLVQVDAGYYFPPTGEVARQWVERTPPGFTMTVKAYSLFSGCPTRPDSLWPEVADEIPIEHRDKPSVYLSHLPAHAVEVAWELYRQALMPLHSAGRLGTVLLQFPRWFRPSPENRALLAELPGRLPDYDVSVEFRHGSWLGDDERERTLRHLERCGLAYVCVDTAQRSDSSVPPVVAATADIAIVRFCGRSMATWDEDAGVTDWAAHFAYRYSEEELAAWIPSLQQLADSARETHVLLSNCYRDDAVVNARQLAELLGAGLQPGAD